MKNTQIKARVKVLLFSMSLVCIVNMTYAQSDEFINFTTQLPTGGGDMYPIVHFDGDSGFRLAVQDPGQPHPFGYNTAFAIELNAINNTWRRLIEMETASYATSYGTTKRSTIDHAHFLDYVGIPGHLAIGDELGSFGHFSEKLLVGGNTKIQGEIVVSSLYVDNGTDYLKVYTGDVKVNEADGTDVYLAWGDDSHDKLIFEHHLYDSDNIEVLNLHKDLIESKVQEVTFNYGSDDDLMQMSLNTSAKIDNAVLTVAGAIYVGPQAGKSSTGELSKFDSEYTNHYNLWVEDGIVTEDIVLVEVDDWSDHVLKEDYELPKLSEVENFIKENGHLKNIPSEKEVKEVGYKQHDLNKSLLEKVEELVLYTIAQEKRIVQLEKQLNAKTK